jgi:hypothetical protein
MKLFILTAALFSSMAFGQGVAPSIESVQSSGTELTRRSTINFMSPIMCWDNPIMNRTDCFIVPPATPVKKPSHFKRLVKKLHLVKK